MDEKMLEQNNKCSCSHHRFQHKRFDLALMVFGGAFLLANIGWISGDALNILWPLAILLPGLFGISGKFCKCCQPRT